MMESIHSLFQLLGIQFIEGNFEITKPDNQAEEVNMNLT